MGKRGLKVFFQNVACKKQINLNSYRRCGEKNNKKFRLLSCFFILLQAAKYFLLSSRKLSGSY